MTAHYYIESGTLNRDGFELRFTIEGRGLTVLVIGSSIYYSRTFSAPLRQHLRFIFADHRGFGTATRSYADSDFTLDKLVEDVEALRNHLNLGRVVVLGHSGHAYIALEYAKRYPQHVSNVVLLAASPDSRQTTFDAADRYFEESVAPERKAGYAAQIGQLAADIEADPSRRFIHYSLRSGPRIWFDYNYDASWLWQDVTVIPEMFDYVWGNVFRKLDIQVRLADLKLPVFVGLGRYDYWNPPYLWDLVRTQFHDLRIRVFEQSGHTPQLEEPALFDLELLAWLETTRES